jgi:cytochrome c553
VKRFFTWAGIGVAGTAVILGLALFVVYTLTQDRMDRVYEVNPHALQVAAEAENGGAAETLARGKRLVTIRGCTDCHGEDLGGGVFADDLPVFRLSATNLTPGGIGAEYTDQDWVRAIRHGLGPDQKPLLFMPSYEYYYLGDEDLAAMIAYMKSLPPITRELPENKVGPLGRILLTAGQLPLLAAEVIDHHGSRPVAPPKGATPAYGEYLAIGCTGCHGAGFSGGKIPGVPPVWPEAPNITPDRETGIGEWTKEDFVRALTEGKRPDGTELQAQFMPWPNMGHLDDVEMEALWIYMSRLPPRPYGER